MHPQDQTRDVKGTPEIHVPFHDGKAKRHLPDKQKLGKLEAQNIHQRRLFIFTGGVGRSSDLVSPSHRTSNLFSIESTLLCPSGPAHRPATWRRGQVTLRDSSVRSVKHGWKADMWRSLPWHLPVLITVDRLLDRG